MKIGIDARPFSHDGFTGISRSIYEIIKVWSKKYSQHEFFLLSGKPIKLDIELPLNWHIIDSAWIINSSKLWAAVRLPELIKKLDLDVYWGSNFVLPRKVSGTKYFVTVYDLALFKFKGIGSNTNTIRVKLFTKSACKKATKVIAISKATANDIIEIMKIPSENVVVSYCGGLSSNYISIPNDIYCSNNGSVNSMLKFKEDFFLFISTIEPRKNVYTIVKAYDQFRENTDSEMKLVLAGKKGWKCENVYEAIEQSKYKRDIILPGFISEDDKQYLLRKAKVFLYPSLYEGFGIPLLEAMEYNIPIITTNVSSLPEVGGNAVFYIDDPYDIDALCKMMQKASRLDGEEIEECICRMKKQKGKFSWEKNANEVMKIFEENI